MMPGSDTWRLDRLGSTRAQLSHAHWMSAAVSVSHSVSLPSPEDAVLAL